MLVPQERNHSMPDAPKYHIQGPRLDETAWRGLFVPCFLPYCSIGIPAILRYHSAAPGWCTLVSFESMAAVTGMARTPNSEQAFIAKKNPARAGVSLQEMMLNYVVAARLGTILSLCTRIRFVILAAMSA